MNFFNNNYLNGLYAVLLAGVSIFTGEIVTFIMLGFVFMALLNINTTLRKILEKMDKQR
ncbi:hypothetical protein [Paenibacillus sp. RC67]|uniref:hypothetical protein n=1 Tax=Paenibacillus sp. RC67 TaxID=3039392 RepID=UPI0024AD06AA|nr:hypothetical protein [Paenibacillus sp. RC67]